MSNFFFFFLKLANLLNIDLIFYNVESFSVCWRMASPLPWDAQEADPPIGNPLVEVYPGAMVTPKTSQTSL